MKVIWKPQYPLAMFLVAETDADRVLVAMMRRTQKLQFHMNAPQEVYEEARKISSGEPNERAAKAMMDEDRDCKRHSKAEKNGCAACLGIAAFSVKPETIETSPPYEEHPFDEQSDIPF